MGTGSEALTPLGTSDSIAYCDTSAILRAYLTDENGHEQTRQRLLSSEVSLVSSAIAEVELTAALQGAVRDGRVNDPDLILSAISDAANGPLLFITLNGARILPTARALCGRHRLRALDAIHLAVALTDGRELAGDGLIFITCDADQAAAARAEGLEVE